MHKVEKMQCVSGLFSLTESSTCKLERLRIHACTDSGLELYAYDPRPLYAVAFGRKCYGRTPQLLKKALSDDIDIPDSFTEALAGLHKRSLAKLLDCLISSETAVKDQSQNQD
jgi:hypothetical protein